MRLEMYCFAYYPLFMAIGALTRWWVWRLVGPIPGWTHMELVNLLKRRAVVNTITYHSHFSVFALEMAASLQRYLAGRQ